MCILCEKNEDTRLSTKCNHCHIRCMKRNELFTTSINVCPLCHPLQLNFTDKGQYMFFLYMCKYFHVHMDSNVQNDSKRLYSIFSKTQIEDEPLGNIIWTGVKPSIQKLNVYLTVLQHIQKHNSLPIHVIKDDILHCYRETVCKSLCKVTKDVKVIHYKYVEFLIKQIEEQKITAKEGNKLMYLACPFLAVKHINMSMNKKQSLKQLLNTI